MDNNMDNNSRIEVELHDTSDKHFYGLVGRYSCTSISTINESFKLFDGERWYEFKTNKNNIKRIKEIALRDKGSLYVKIRCIGIGYVLDEELFN